MPSPTTPAPAADPARRSVLKKLAAGSAAAWVAPAMVATTPAAAQGSDTFAASAGCDGTQVLFNVTVPASYVNAGYYYSFALQTELMTWNSCTQFAPTAYPITVSPIDYGFIGFGLTGTVTIWVHNGDCTPIATLATDMPFDCAPSTAPGSLQRSGGGRVDTTRSATGEVTVSGS